MMAPLPKSYEIVGDIAVVEIADGQVREEVAHAIMKEHGGVHVVAAKKRRVGLFREKEIEFIVGKRSTTLHQESGCRLLVDVASCYFSEREKGERKRISEMVQEGETLLVPFAGVGPFPILIAKRKRVEIKAIELNPKAFKFLTHNITLNRLSDRIEAIFGDAYALKLNDLFDRIIVPQPYRHDSFSHFAPLSKKGGFMHYYTWLGRDDPVPAFPNFEVVEARKISSYAPKVWKWCFDLEKV